MSVTLKGEYLNLSKQNQRLFSSLALAFSLLLNAGETAEAVEKEHNGWIFADNIGGVKLAYPANWKKSLSSANEPDNLLKVSGPATGSVGSFGELSLAVSKDEISPALFFKLIEEAYWSKLTEAKSTREKPVHVAGASAALERELTFRHAGQLVCQRYLVFQIGKRTYHIIFTCPQSDFAGTGTLWNSFTTSLAPAAASAGTAASAADNQTSYSTWRSHGGELTVSYPSFFKSEGSDDDAHILRTSGNRDGKYYGLDIFKGEAATNLNLGQHALYLEEKYFAQQKNYHKIKDAETNFGNASGILQESTFENGGNKIHHLTGYIFADNHLWAIALSTAGVNYNEAHQMWSRIASSIKAH